MVQNPRNRENKMTIRYYCDYCETEITDKNCQQKEFIGEMKRNGKILIVKLKQPVPHGDNCTEVCKFCMLDAISTLDTRPMHMKVDRALGKDITINDSEVPDEIPGEVVEEVEE